MGDTAVQVIEQTFEDAGEQDANGLWNYYYSGVIYRFIFPELEFQARRYDDEPGQASFLGFAANSGSECHLFEAIPYDDPAFAMAAAYLRNTLGANPVTVLLPNGYFPIDFTRFPVWPQASADALELLRCFQCHAAIPEGMDKCPACGWTWQY
jgi:hypothetical protein